MLPARSAALERLLAQFAEGDDEMLKKHSPKMTAVEVAAPAEETSEIPPELIAKIVEALKSQGNPEDGDLKVEATEEAHGAPETDPSEMKMSSGGMVEEEGLGDKRCRGCGLPAYDCVCEKRAEGGLIEGDGLNDEVMKRRQTERDVNSDKNASDDMDELAGGKPRRPQAVVRRSRYTGG